MISKDLLIRHVHNKYKKELEERKHELHLLAHKFKHSVSEIEILRWLHNFNESDREDALKILFAVEYLDESDIMDAYNAGLKEIIEEYPNSQLLIQPIGDYGKSATAMVYYLSLLHNSISE
jgi:hypothetical protein